jgi:hypothetical protein
MHRSQAAMSMIFRGWPPTKQSSRCPREKWGRMPVAAVDADASGLASGLQSNAQWMI